MFGWATRHKPRMIEYPWILEKFAFDMKNIKILDFGAGVTPLPVIFSQRNAKVITVDNSKLIRDPDELYNANEWGFIDYSKLFPGIVSLNEDFDINTVGERQLDVFYSISVVEHMPAEIRRKIFSIAAYSLKIGGSMILSVDLIKHSEDLWNQSSGNIVDIENAHGTLNDLLDELKAEQFEILESEIISLKGVENIDLGLITAVKL
jgi:2-polyprenyl-3-methyl-5-hydroxy-6-metoxy-1,4-benzoquinol methylase